MRGFYANHAGGADRGLPGAGGARPLDAVASIKVPALVVVGERDEATPPISLEFAALLADACLVEIEGRAYVPQPQDPARFRQAVLPFLDRHDRGT